MAKTVGFQDIPTKDLVNDPTNVRHRANPVGELEESIKHHGMLEPIIVRKVGSKFGVVVGSRRFSAAKALGLKSIPAIVKELSDEEAFIESAVENIQRELLDPADEIAIVAKIQSLYNNVGEVARILDRSKKWVEDRLQVRDLIHDVRKASERGSRGPTPPVQVPRDMTKIAGIARAAEAVYEKEPEKRAALFDELKDRPREQVDRVVKRLRAYADEEPEKVARRPVREVVTEVLAPNRLELTMEFSTEVSRGILKAARARDVAEEDVVQTAVEDWLRRNKFL